MAKLIGTAGHVDHGKTTLLRALTGIDADRLPEEKRRGMTIDVGFAYIDLPNHGRVSIVDVPGHERFLRNMLVGAQGINVALLCVAADESVMPQTREHLQILQLLPVEAMVVALTRSDLADAETRAIAAEEVRELVAPTRFKGSPLVEVSAETGEGLDGLKAELDLALGAPQAAPAGAWHMPIDRVFTAKGRGVVVTGTLAGGLVRVGDLAEIQPGAIEVRVRGIHSHSQEIQLAEPGRRVALNLAGVREEDLYRGQAIGALGALFETRCLDAACEWLERPRHGERIRASIGSEEAIGRLFLSDSDDSLAQLRLEGPVACALGQPVILRRYSPPKLLGGGLIRVPQAKLRRKGERVVEAPKAATDEEAIMEVLHDAQAGLPTEEVCRRLGKTPQALGDAFQALVASDQARGFAGLWFGASAFQQASERFLAVLAAIHDEEPMTPWQPREKAVTRAGLAWSGKPLDRIVSALAAEGYLEAAGTTIKAAGFRIRLTERQRRFLDRVRKELATSGVSPPTAHELAQRVAAPVQAIEEILKLGVQAGEVLSLGEGLFYTQEQITRIIADTARLAGSRPFTAAEFRDMHGTSRKYAIPLLEYFDSHRATTRVGDKRIVNEGQR